MPSPLHATPSVGAPWVVIGVAVLVDELGVALQQRLDAGTPSTAAICSASSAGIGSRSWVPPPCSNATVARTSRSTFSLICVNRLSNVLRRLSASTNEPTTNDDADEDGDGDGEQPPDPGADAAPCDQRRRSGHSVAELLRCGR